MTLSDFVAKYQGKEVTDPWGTYKGECVSLAKMWLKENNWPMLRGNAIMWQYNGGGQYQWIPNRPWNFPRPGDLIVFNVGQYGHIGVVVWATVWKVAVFNQNWPQGNDTDPAQITIFNYIRPRCVGWLRYTG